jgi:hypothetical protein
MPIGDGFAVTSHSSLNIKWLCRRSMRLASMARFPAVPGDGYTAHETTSPEREPAGD